MKTFNFRMITVIALTFGFVEISNAQKQSTGLYLTYNDYLNHKLSYTADKTNPNGNKLLIHEFIGMNKVTVISNGKKTMIPKSGLFGYHDSNGNDYRFYENKAFQVIDTTAFYIYSYDKLIQQGKGPKPTRVYYFSKKTDDKILPLTSENIAKAFPKNAKFRYMVEVAAKTNLKLDAYDNEANEYKIKELYAESLK
ncbi:MAG: hypothetical protein JWP44_3796 [Mucilaginibacter sp.]|nr:hypothetical protein [Mucilaginibacter sp.]